MEFRKNIVNESNWIGDVKIEYHTPEGLFSKSGSEIASKLLSDSNNPVQAMKRLNFYINRSGSNISNKTELEKAKSIISDKIKKHSENTSEGLTSNELMIITGNIGRHNFISDDKFDSEQLWDGIIVEFEHIPDEILDNNYDTAITIARNIAKDHLSEGKNYYIELDKMEKNLSESTAISRNRIDGIDTMFKFFKIASSEDKIKMKRILEGGTFEEYIKLVREVVKD